MQNITSVPFDFSSKPRLVVRVGRRLFFYRQRDGGGRPRRRAWPRIGYQSEAVTFSPAVEEDWVRRLDNRP